MLPADELGDGVNLICGKRDNGAAGRQPRQFARSRKSQLRQARPRDHRDARQQSLNGRLQCRCADDPRVLAAAAVQQPIGKRMPPIQISCELRLVNRHERHIQVTRHGFNG